jgi:hypothetical protein
MSLGQIDRSAMKVEDGSFVSVDKPDDQSVMTGPAAEMTKESSFVTKGNSIIPNA